MSSDSEFCVMYLYEEENYSFSQKFRYGTSIWNLGVIDWRREEQDVKRWHLKTWIDDRGAIFSSVCV